MGIHSSLSRDGREPCQRQAVQLVSRPQGEGGITGRAKRKRSQQVRDRPIGGLHVHLHTVLSIRVKEGDGESLVLRVPDCFCLNSVSIVREEF